MVRTAVESERAYGHGSVSGSLAEAAHHLPVARLQGPDATDLHPEKLHPPGRHDLRAAPAERRPQCFCR